MRKQSITSNAQRTQSVSSAPETDVVTVAVLPPRLPTDVAPPTGIAAATAFDWDERVNWVHNEKISEEEATSAKKWTRKLGFTTQRKKANDMPPFVFRKIPYDTWRKHYAKDKEGRYRGTLAPAEDCLLLPEDVELWRLGDPETKADLWTRGKAALPVYDEHHEELLPQYSRDYDGPSTQELKPEPGRPQVADRSSSFMADGKTSQQIISEARAKLEADKNKNKSWKNSIKRGAEFAMMGTNT